MNSDENMTWTDLWAECTDRLGNSDEARHIIEQASGRQGASWLITLTTPAPPSATERVTDMIRRRLAGEPLQYVLGRWGFRQLNLHVDRRVLIPRPETEQVVQAAIDSLQSMMTPTPRPLIIDLGTGSGAIALSLAMEIPDAEVLAIDTSTDALDVAALNLSELPPQIGERVSLLHGSWFEPLPTEMRGHVDMIVSNPPYVAENERETVEQIVLDWEPQSALFAGPEGMNAIEHIVREASGWLRPRGSLVVEIAPQQAERVERLAWETGFFSVGIGTDMTNRKRWLMATR